MAGWRLQRAGIEPGHFGMLWIIYHRKIMIIIACKCWNDCAFILHFAHPSHTHSSTFPAWNIWHSRQHQTATRTLEKWLSTFSGLEFKLTYWYFSHFLSGRFRTALQMRRPFPRTKRSICAAKYFHLDKKLWREDVLAMACVRSQIKITNKTIQWEKSINLMGSLRQCSSALHPHSAARHAQQWSSEPRTCRARRLDMRTMQWQHKKNRKNQVGICKIFTVTG